MRDARIGQPVRVQRGAIVCRSGERIEVHRHGGDHPALVQLDRHGARYAVRLRDRRAATAPTRVPRT